MITLEWSLKVDVDLLIWLGYESYPTVDAFMQEARVIGVSRRVPRIPAGLDPPGTRLWVAHDVGHRGFSAVWGWASVTHVAVVSALLPDAPSYVRWIDPKNLMTTSPRGGQMMMEGGIYLRGDSFNEIAPRAISLSRFRSYKWVDREAMLALPEIKVVQTEPAQPIPSWTPWSSDELGTIIDRAHAIGPYQACKEHNRLTGRSFEGCLWQYKRWKRGQHDA